MPKRDLDQKITAWRQQMMAGGIRNPAILDELESHLREDIERQTQAGDSEPVAFASAVKRIGPPGVIQREFGKTRLSRALEKMMMVMAGLVAVFGIFLTTVT